MLKLSRNCCRDEILSKVNFTFEGCLSIIKIKVEELTLMHRAKETAPKKRSVQNGIDT